MADNQFRPPKMSYAPGIFETWEYIFSFTVVDAPFETVRPIAEGVIRARQGPSGEIVGECRPPLMAQSQMQADADANQATPGASLVFDSELESKARQLHGISVRLGNTIERLVHLARGHEKA
jgi:hypothetical protein